MTNDRKSRWIDSLMGRMNLDQKVGQLVVFGMNGTVVTPDMLELISRHHVGGVRVSMKARLTTLATLHSYARPGDQHTDMTMRSVHPPSGLCKDLSFSNHPPVVTNGQYAEFLNTLRKASLERDLGIPVHFAIDQEGNGTDDLLGTTRLFPYPMGMASTGDMDLAYRIGLCTARQARAAGINIVQAVIDVNTNAANPEVGPRSFGDDPARVCKWAERYFGGLKDGGVTATGKHFAGRGDAASDAHWDLPVCRLDRRTLVEQHLKPYMHLMKKDLLPSIMVTHCIYPCLGDDKLPASISRAVLTDFLRGEMGYQGVVVTDNMMMGGIILKYEMSDAIVMALQAGCDLVLCRDESPIRQHILRKIAAAISSGALPEKEVDEKVQRILAMRWDMGLASPQKCIADPAKADAATRAPIALRTCSEAAEKSVLLLRDRAGHLPLDPGKRVLLVEQAFVTQIACNNRDCHPGLLWEEMSKLSPNVGSIELSDLPGEAEIARLRRRLAAGDFDAIVTTNYFHYKVGGSIIPLVKEMMATGKPVIVLANNPFKFCVDEEFPTVLVTFQPASRDHMRVVAEAVFGRRRLTARLPVKI
jgi:beta-N-acetylhexosaminidase